MKLLDSFKSLFNNVSILNVILLGAAVFLFFQFDYPLINKKIKIVIPKSSGTVPVQEEKNVAENNVAYLYYAAIVEKNLFHPERKVPSRTGDDQPLVRPEITLFGTLITGEKRIAYIEDKKNPYSTPGRGKRQVAVTEGGMIAGYKLVKVNTESIVLLRGEDKMVVTLDTQKDRKPGETTSKAQVPGQPSSAVRSSMPPPIPSAPPQVRPSQPYMPPAPIPARPH